MERFFNTVFYFAYVFICKMVYYFYKYSGIFKMYELPFAQKRFKKLGIKDPVANLMDAWKRHDIGLGIMFSAGLMLNLLSVFFLGLNLLYFAFVEKPKNDDLAWYIIILYAIILFLYSWKLIFHKAKYRKYFKEFERKDRKWKIKWAWISLGVILFPFIVLACSFRALFIPIG